MKDRLQLTGIAIASFTLSMGIWAMQERPWRTLKLAQVPVERPHPRTLAPSALVKPLLPPLPQPALLPQSTPAPTLSKPPAVKPPDEMPPAVLPPPVPQGDNQVVQEKAERKFARGQVERAEP